MHVHRIESPEQLRDFLARGATVYEVREFEGRQAESEPHHKAWDGHSGNWSWQEVKIDDPTPFNPEAPLPLNSTKQFFFCEREPLYRFDGETFRDVLPEVSPLVLFGVHACDLTAIAYQDRFFADDPHYRQRRRQALLVGIDCLTPCASGFCLQVDAGPFVRETTADLILAQGMPERDPRWSVAVCSEWGAAALQGLQLADGDESWQRKRRGREHHLTREWPRYTYIDQGIRNLNEKKIDNETWRQIGHQCLSCSGCTSLCPTCSCYATRERPGENGEQVTERYWDSCLFRGFQQEASGANPSALPAKRNQRFWHHKFSDEFTGEFSRYGCVGCGRCETTCPGVVGVHQVMKKLGTPCTD